MTELRYFGIDPLRIVHDTIEGETILIDLDTGTYFSLGGSGPEVWELLAAGLSDVQTSEEMARRYPDAPQAAADGTTDLIRELLENDILREGPAPRLRPTPPEVSASPQAFQPPVLEAFTDMQHFLMLDPIHEVADSGWPREAPAAQVES
jgi:hypothetical protein